MEVKDEKQVSSLENYQLIFFVSKCHILLLPYPNPVKLFF